jgi:hypothetical protein
MPVTAGSSFSLARVARWLTGAGLAGTRLAGAVLAGAVLAGMGPAGARGAAASGGGAMSPIGASPLSGPTRPEPAFAGRFAIYLPPGFRRKFTGV